MKRETQRQQLIRWAKGLGAKVSSGRGWVSISWLSWQQDFDSWAEAYAAAVRWQRAHEEGQPWPWAEYQAWESRRRTHPGEMPPPRRRNPALSRNDRRTVQRIVEWMDAEEIKPLSVSASLEMGGALIMRDGHVMVGDKVVAYVPPRSVLIEAGVALAKDDDAWYRATGL